MFKGIRIWGVVAGFIVDVVVTLLIFLEIGIGVLIVFAVIDHGDSTLIQVDIAAAFRLIWFRFFGEGFGCLGSFLGGFIASWIGSEARMKNAVCVIILELVLFSITEPFTYTPPLWMELLALAARLGSIYLGGLLANRIL
jgi:hypothetical protein